MNFKKGREKLGCLDENVWGEKRKLGSGYRLNVMLLREDDIRYLRHDGSI